MDTGTGTIPGRAIGAAVVEVAANVKDAGRFCRERREQLLIDCPLSVDAVQTAGVLALCDLALLPVQPLPDAGSGDRRGRLPTEAE